VSELKKTLGFISASLVYLAGLILIVSTVIYFIWNTAVVWMVPTLDHMGIFVALGIGTLFSIANNLINFWTNRYMEIKKVKALEALHIVSSLNSELAFIKTVLYEKEILNDIDFIAMETVKTKGAR
jgi:hypothetical protein